MKYFWVCLISISATISCRIVNDVQLNSDGIKANAININDIAKIVEEEIKNEKTASLLEKTGFDLELAIEQALKKKGLVNVDGVLKVMNPVAKVAGGFLGIPPAVTDSALGFLLLMFGGDKIRQRKKEKLLAETEPELAKKML